MSCPFVDSMRRRTDWHLSCHCSVVAFGIMASGEPSGSIPLLTFRRLIIAFSGCE